jgi:putative peptidoglycan lipid II flippase
VHAALLSFGVNLVLSLVLMEPYGTVGLALASNVAVLAQAVYLQIHLARQQEGLGFRALVGDLVKVIVAAVVMGGVVAGGWEIWTRFFPPTKISDAVALVMLIGAGVGVYAAVVWALKIQGREDITALLKRRRGKLM